jgi:TRAP-type C4-dicarboxylate transport system substrate-binding protein
MQKVRTIRWAAGALACALALAVTACAGSSGDKAGGKAKGQPRVLALANITGDVQPQLQVFADEVNRRTDGTLVIEFKSDWRQGDPDAERRTIEDVKAGKVDMAWTGARVFDRLGVKSFQALLAPLLVDSYELEGGVFERGLPTSMLEGVEELGVAGIGVLPGPIRRLLGVSHPFLRPSDFDGQVIGGAENELSVRTFQALGARLEALPAGAPLDGLDATEQHLGAMWGNRYDEVAKHVGANVNLWPRPLVIFAGEDVFESLSSDHRAALRQAATAAVPAALAAARVDDDEAALSLCGQGATFAVASDSDLTELRRALEPLYAELRSDPGTKAALDTITSLKSQIGASAAVPTCASTEPPGTASAIPEGRYEMTLTPEDWRTAGITVEDWVEAGLSEKEASESTGKYVMIIDAGELTILTPNGEPGFQASYSVFRDQIEAQEAEDFTILARWSLKGDALSFSDVRVPHGDARIAIVAWTTHPWVRAD